MNLLQRSLILTAFAVLAGCAPAPLKKLDTPMVEAEKADHVVIFIAQSEVAVDDVDVSNGGGGLLGALIEIAVESAKTKNRQEAIAPLRDALLDFEFEAKLIESIKARLPVSLVKADATFKIVHNEAEWRTHLASVVPANVFLVTPRYAFEQDFDIAYVHATAALQQFRSVPPEEKVLKKMSRAEREAVAPMVLHAGSYFSQHVTHSPFERQRKAPGEAGYEHDAAQWRSDGAQPVRDAFAKALDEIALLIQRDGEHPLPRIKKGKTRVYLASPWVQPMLLKGAHVGESPGRSLLMLGESAYWVDDRQIKR